jgi:lipopolysaccharide transport system ATP-binding protein
MKPVIRVENLSKQYAIPHAGRRHPADGGFRHVLENGVQTAVRCAADLVRGRRSLTRDPTPTFHVEKFWALKDVSFTVQQGQCVGIIGRNGAGKSTLLKILSRITEPTAGVARLRGRVGCLLEVGTGFHPELTGRENIFLNGAILGMKRAEVARKFDEIVAFAEVDKFVDTPVKHYSSGMYMRLAFAVAAHLEPEILIVDEVLAVGDAEFQRKCLGKMGEVARAGRTVLFVSHNIGAVQSLCEQAVLLEAGRLAHVGRVQDVIPRYLKAAGTVYFATDARPMMIQEATLTPPTTETPAELTLSVAIQSDRVTDVGLGIRLTDAIGVPVAYGSLGSLETSGLLHLQPGITRVTFCHAIEFLAIGSYFISLELVHPFVAYLDRAENCLAFELHAHRSEPGRRRLEQKWEHGSWSWPTTLLSVEHEDDAHVALDPVE